jgi:hypothetical protein
MPPKETPVASHPLRNHRPTGRPLKGLVVALCLVIAALGTVICLWLNSLNNSPGTEVKNRAGAVPNEASRVSPRSPVRNTGSPASTTNANDETGGTSHADPTKPPAPPVASASKEGDKQAGDPPDGQGKPPSDTNMPPAKTGSSPNHEDKTVADRGEPALTKPEDEPLRDEDDVTRNTIHAVQQTIEPPSDLGKAQPAFLAMIAIAKNAAGTDQMVATIRQRNLVPDMLTSADMLTLRQDSGLSPAFGQKLLGLVVNDNDHTHASVKRFFPMDPGMAWDYEVNIKGDFWVGDGCMQAIRKADGLSAKQQTRYVIDKSDSNGRLLTVGLTAINDLVTTWPSVTLPTPASVCPACAAVLRGDTPTTSTRQWAVTEKDRQAGTASGPLGKDLVVIERITRKWRDPSAGGRKFGMCSHEVFFAPLLDCLVHENSRSGVRTSFHLGQAPVTTPLGVYAGCIERLDERSFEGGKWRMVSYFAPGVGLVKRCQYAPGGALALEMILTRITKDGQPFEPPKVKAPVMVPDPKTAKFPPPPKTEKKPAPVPVPVPPRPPPPSLTRIARDRGMWPAEVKLTANARFPIMISGVNHGDFMVPAGTSVKLLEVTSTTVKVKYRDSIATLNPDKTDLMRRMNGTE